MDQEKNISSVSSPAESLTVTWDGPGWDWSSVSSPAESLLHEMAQDEIDHLCPLQRNHCYMRWTRMRLIICVLSSGITNCYMRWTRMRWIICVFSSGITNCYMRWTRMRLIICVLSSGITNCYMRWTRMRLIICVLSSGITVTWDGPGWDWSSVSSPAESLLHEMDQDEMDHLCLLQRNQLHEMDQDEIDHLCLLQRNH